MSFVPQITSAPLPYNQDRAQTVRDRFAASAPEFRTLLAGTAGCSPYLAHLIDKEADWIERLNDQTAQSLRDAVWEELAAPAPEVADGGAAAVISAKQLAPHFRQAKRRIALLSALADVGGVWDLQEVCHSLTTLADRCLQIGLQALVAAQISRNKLPGLGPDDIENCGGMVVLAMGKMGAYELNYSSDIDLICLFDESRFEPESYMQVRQTFVKITRALMALLSDITADGYVFRTDLRLRPDASVTPVCIGMGVAEQYYESLGRTWERAAYIKARPCAGDLEAGQQFLSRLSPFIWRKHLDFAAIQDAHDMRLRIRDHKNLGGPFVLEGHDVKLGSGGIREIEFFTQTRQIIAGGRDERLRKASTLDGLDALVAADWVPAASAELLKSAYVAHRKLEHRLQMINDAQTHSLPGSAQDFDRLAMFMGERDTQGFRAALIARFAQVAELSDAFFTPEDDAPAQHPDGGGRDKVVEHYLEAWRYTPALRSRRSVKLFRRVFPDIYARMQMAARPQEALAGFEQFIRGLPAGVQLFSLFAANPSLTELIVDICSTSPALSEYLSRNSEVLDAVIAGDFFADWPGEEVLCAQLHAVLAKHHDYEAQLDAARRWQKEWHFRIGVHHLKALISPDLAAEQYAQLAQVVLVAMHPVVEAEFSRKHGPPPGRGAVILGMGSLGAGRLAASSDLDVIVIYDSAGQEGSDGPRPLVSGTYYARLTQSIITALKARTALGKLYDVDMRLRPSGQAGPVATSLEAYESYQKNDAWVWEHLALTRARVISGPPELARDVARIRAEILTRAPQIAQIKSQTLEMRDRLFRARAPKNIWDVKSGAGGMQDIELFLQALTLMAQQPARTVQIQLDVAVEAGLLTPPEHGQLCAAYEVFSRFQQATRLVSAAGFDPDTVGAGAVSLVLRDCGLSSLSHLQARFAESRQEAAQVIERGLSENS